MVCDHCGSDAHVTGYKDCPRFCTACKAQGHHRRSNACPKRACTKCGRSGHIARQCTFCDTCKAHHARGACICSMCKTHHRKDECPQESCTKCGQTGHIARQCTFCDACKAHHAKGACICSTCGTHHRKDECPQDLCAYCEEFGHTDKRCPGKPPPACSACGSSTHQTPRAFDCPEHKCATCKGELEPKGHNYKYCPSSTCDSCKLSGHISDVCTFRECYNVEIDFLNVLLLSRGRHTIDDYFETQDVTVRPNDLRIEGKFLEFTDWTHVAQRFPLSDRQVLELKSVAHAYKRTSSREYDRTKRELDHPSNAPIHFAFPTHQAQPDGTLRPTIYAQDIPMCPLCLTWKFPQEMGRAKWCCRGGELIDVIAPWTQPTPEFRALCLDNTRAAIDFRASSRKYNNEVSFGSYGINYGAAKTLPVPSFLTISGHTYCRVLSGEDDGPLKYYIYDPTYTRDTQLKPETLRIVRECIAAKNNLAKVLKQFGGRSDIEQLIVCIESIPADIQAPDFAGLYIRPKGDVTTSPRKLVIYPTKQSFQDAHPDLDEAKGQNGLFVPTSHRLYEALLYPSFAIGGTADPGWDSTLFSPTTGKKVTLQQYARCRALSIERLQDGSGQYRRTDSGGCIADPAWFAQTQGGLYWPFNRTQCLGRLSNQWFIDSYCRIEDANLEWARQNQALLCRGGADGQLNAASGQSNRS